MCAQYIMKDRSEESKGGRAQLERQMGTVAAAEAAVLSGAPWRTNLSLH